MKQLSTMKIIEIGTGYTPIPAKIGAATEIVIENLLREFENLSISTELIDISFNANDISIDERLYSAKVKRIVLPKWLNRIEDFGLIHYLRRIIYSYLTGLYLKKYLRQETQSVHLHFHNQFNYYIVNLMLKRMLQKIDVHTIYTIHSPNWLIVNKVPKRYFLEKKAIENCNYVIALTEKIKTQICNLIPSVEENKIQVIPNGVSSHFYHVLKDAHKENSIINVGSICDRKNQLGSIEILKDFLLKNNFVFKFAGKIAEPVYFQKIENYIKENALEKHVEYVGELKPGKELNLFYNKSKFYISHSKQEAFSLVILEAMIAGTPVILGDNYKSFLDEKTDLFEVIEFVNSIKFVSKLEELDKNNTLYELYRKSQISFIKEKYSWTKVAGKLLEVLYTKQK